MGNCFSDPSAPKQAKKNSSGSNANKGHVLGSAPTQPAVTPVVAVPAGTSSAPLSPPILSPGRILGDGFEDANRGNDARSMAAAAAEERMKSVSRIDQVESTRVCRATVEVLAASTGQQTRRTERRWKTDR